MAGLPYPGRDYLFLAQDPADTAEVRSQSPTLLDPDDSARSEVQQRGRHGLVGHRQSGPLTTAATATTAP
jgi:hypothetical protein